MNRQHVFIHKFLLTIITYMFLLPTMHPPQMIIQISAAFKSFRAHLTNTKIVRMCRHVNVNCWRCSPRIITQFAGVKPLVAVRFQVNLHRGFWGEFLTAGFAYVIFYVRVHGDDVLGEGGFWIKTTGTLFAPARVCVNLCCILAWIGCLHMAISVFD